MEQDEFLIFAELKRDRFDDILDRLMSQFADVRFGRQGDDWIWVHTDDGRVEIDSFYSEQLEVKGKRVQARTIDLILGVLERDWITSRFNPPKQDLTR